MDVLLLVVILFGCFAIGVPVAYSLALASIAGAMWLGVPLEAVMLKISSGVSKFAMLTIPFFILAGAIMAEGGMARRLVAFANVLAGFFRGGLSVVNIVATSILSGISGSSVADATAIGSVMIPQMEKAGYSRGFSTSVTISASVQGILVPPSHNAVIYSLATGGVISITSLFMAGVIPGLLIALALIFLVLLLAYRKGHPKGELMTLGQALRLSFEAMWGLITIVIIIGGILSGVFTPIEAGAIASVWAFLVTMFIYRDTPWKDLPYMLYRTVRTSAMVLTLIACAAAFGYVMALMQLPAKLTELMLATSSNKYVILMLVNLMLLALGFLEDMAPSILITTPILLPAVENVGVHPVHFGIIMLLNLAIGLVHPPVGSTLIVGCAVGKVSMEELMKDMWPFYIVLVGMLILVTYIPALSLWLPSLLGL